MEYRIFTNDRGKRGSVFLYSALSMMEAATAQEAENKAERKYGPPPNRAGERRHGPGRRPREVRSPLKAIEWPPIRPESKRWLAEHVGTI